MEISSSDQTFKQNNQLQSHPSDGRTCEEEPALKQETDFSEIYQNNFENFPKNLFIVSNNYFLINMQSVFTKSKATCLLWCFKLEKKRKETMQCETLHHETKENLPVFLGFLLGYVFVVSTKGSGGGRSVLN